MLKYSDYSKEQLAELLSQLQGEYLKAQSQNLSLDMSRGKPGTDQLELSVDMLSCIDPREGFDNINGFDCRNYGLLDGIPEAKQLMADIMGVSGDNVFIGGNSSLNLMHDCVAHAYIHGTCDCDIPWSKTDSPKFLCPVPGYDRHFAITQHFGIDMVCVPMASTGPDMDILEKIVQSDSSIKGMWCIPKYSNPTGITYSDETVRRLAALKPAAKDFRIFWDNAYAVHDLYTDRADVLADILSLAAENGNENMVYVFSSTSKITFPGAGISAVAGSKQNIEYIKKHMSLQTISYDKLNQLRHARYLKDMNGVAVQMKKHMNILAPKFEMTLQILESELSQLGIAQWEKPNGGYFILLNVPDGCAKKVVQLCAGAGVAMTPAGATHPYGKDPGDSAIRIAPTYPSTSDLRKATELLCLCVKIAALQQLNG